MGPPWAYAFPAAVAVTVVVTPLMRHLALATGLVDHPDARKSHGSAVAYLGGVGIIAGVLVALAFLPNLGSRAAALVLAGASLGAIGLLDDDRTVPPGVRFLAELAAAALAAAVGLRIHATGIEGVDIVLTVVWIVGITNALNLLDNMDGLAAGVAGTTAVAVFFLAMLNGQEVPATVAAGLTGACGGFLVFNRQPASIFMGDAGSLFLGFVLAVLTIDVNPGLSPPDSFAVPLVLLGLAVLDTSTVTVARLRRGKRVTEGGKDHLSHRLVAVGLSPRAAVDLLVAVQAVLTVLSVLAGRQVIPLAPACVGAGVVLVILSVITCRARVYEEPIRRLPASVPIALLVAVAAVVLMASPAVLAMVRAHGLSRQATDAAIGALERGGDADPGQTRAELARAASLFRRAQGHLSGPFVSFGLLIPGVSPNLRATRSLAASGADVADAGNQIAALGEAGQARVMAGSVGSDDLAGLAPRLDAAVRTLSRAQGRLVGVDRPYVLPGLRRSVRTFAAQIRNDTTLADQVAHTARLLPGILGNGGSRRYVLVLKDGGRVAEVGSHIVAANYLVAEGGHVSVQHADGPQGGDDVARNLSTTSPPDFPTEARALSEQYRGAGNRPPDGVVAVDAHGLASLATLVGPTKLPSVSNPLAPADIVDVAGRAAVGTEANSDAVLLSGLADSVWGAISTDDLGQARRVVESLATAARDGHLMIYLRDAGEEAAMVDLSFAGEVPAVHGDSVIMTSHPVSGPTADRYLRETVTYDVALRPGSKSARLTGRLAVALRNDAPPPQASGDYGGSTQESRTSVSVYSPFSLSVASGDGHELAAPGRRDLGRVMSSAVLGVPPSQARSLRFDVAGDIALDPHGWYRLDLLYQTAAEVEGRVAVSVPPGWRIVEARGLARSDGRHAVGPLPDGRDRSLWVRIERSFAGDFWDRLVGHR